MDRTNAIIIAAAIIIGALLHGGIYDIKANTRGSSNVINKLTGNTWLCYPTSQDCVLFPERAEEEEDEVVATEQPTREPNIFDQFDEPATPLNLEGLEPYQ